MSHEANTRLFEEAAELIDYWQGTMHAKIMESHLEANDLDGLHESVAMARREMLNQEYDPPEEQLSDEDIARIAKGAWTGKLESEDVF